MLLVADRLLSTTAAALGSGTWFCKGGGEANNPLEELCTFVLSAHTHALACVRQAGHAAPGSATREGRQARGSAGEKRREAEGGSAWL